MTNFDNPIGRRETGSLKWDRRGDLDPFWVADMDFTSPPEVIDTIRKRVDHGVFGYAVPHPSLVETLQGYLLDRIGYTCPEEEIIHLGGLVPALSLAARAFGKPGEKVLTCTPIYPPFLGIHNDASMELLSVDHVEINGQWTFDWQALEDKVTSNTKIFLLSNPQNPMGRVFKEEEIIQLATFCEKHDLILLSDEIHCDLILDDVRHIPAGLINEEIAQRTITLMAPSKTYNIPGLGTSFAIIPDGMLRRKFVRATSGIVAEVNSLGYAACEAAYGKSEAWRQGLLDVLRGNRDRLLEFIASDLPDISMDSPMQATYLAWLNVSALGLKDPITHFEKHGVGLTDGAFFGAKPGDYIRINLGCTRATLEEALIRMKKAVEAI